MVATIQLLFAFTLFVICICFSRMVNNLIDSAFSAFSFVGSLFIRKVIDHRVEFQLSSLKILNFSVARLSFGYKDKRDGRICGPEVCKYCRKEIASEKSKTSIAHDGALTREAIEIVMGRLGIGSCSDDIESRNEEKCRDCRLLEGVTILLEEKKANLEELEEAFSVYDENGDGFIDAEELQRVMCSLEFEEGMNLKDCHTMIQALDENGDGRIDFHEFKNIMENGI